MKLVFMKRESSLLASGQWLMASGLKILLILLIMGIGVQTNATQARIESMGKRPAFFLDDMSIFDNPANATFYSSALIGELGFFDQKQHSPRIGINQDPYTPWFGAMFQFGFSDKGFRDPEVTIGGFFGRENYELTRFIPREVTPYGSGEAVPIPQSITNFDGFIAGTMRDGSALGVHVYVGVQDGKQNDPKIPGGNGGKIDHNAHVSILSMDYGANILVTSESSAEVSVGIARIQYGGSRKTFLDPGLFSFYSQGRFFLEMNAWSGQLVTGYKVADYEVPGWEENFYDINAGLNVIIPRGLVWFGIDGVHIKEFVSTWERKGSGDNEYLVYHEPGSRSPDKDLKDRTDKIGGILSFGIERNIWGNWFIIRTGGQKSFIYETCHNSTGKSTICNVPAGKGGNFWSTNPYGDGTLNDHVGFGIGLNIDGRLKIDANLAEDLLFRNPFSGEGRFVSRISAMYSF